MKIAIFSDSFYPELSGITDSITFLGKALALRGHKIVYFAPRYSEKNYKTSNLAQTEQDLGANIRVIRLPSIPYPFSPNNQGRIAIPIGSGLMAMKQCAPDVIHTQTSMGPGIEAMLSSRLLKIPLVGTNHTPISEFMKSSPNWLVQAALNYTSWYYNRCCFVSAPCQSLLDEMKSHGFNSPSKPVPNPIDTKAFTPVKDLNEKKDLKNLLGFSNFTILYTGRLAPEKQVDVIVKAVALAAKQIPDISFAATGHGSSEKYLKELTEKLGIQDRVKFLGFVKDQEYPLLYKASDVFVIMSKAESQSLSLMDAMLTGLPVIGADARALPEYIDEKSGVVVPVGNDLKLSEAIIDLYNNPKKATKLGHGGIASASRYAPPLIAEIWEKIYQDAISSNKKVL